MLAVCGLVSNGAPPFSSRGASIHWCERRGGGEVEWPQFVVLAVRSAGSSVCWQFGVLAGR